MRLNARSPSCGDRLVILVDVVQRRLEDDVRLPLVPERDQELEDLLAVLRERAHVEVVHGEVIAGDAELGGRGGDLVPERVGREALGQRAGRDRERDVAHLGALLDEPRHRAAAAELAVVGVRREHERPLPARRSCALHLPPRDGRERERGPEERILDQRVVEEAVHGDGQQG